MGRPFQFSLRALLVVIGLGSVGLAAFIVKPNWVAILAIRFVVLAAFGLALTLLLHGGRPARVFGSGAIFPLLAGAVWAVKPVFLKGPNVLGPVTSAELALSNMGDEYAIDVRFRAAFFLSAALFGGLISLIGSLALKKVDP